MFDLPSLRQGHQSLLGAGLHGPQLRQQAPDVGADIGRDQIQRPICEQRGPVAARAEDRCGHLLVREHRTR
eukprot:1724465-Alexandrium_andersonii.AAC.1